jgi:hypothetical protein
MSFLAGLCFFIAWRIDPQTPFQEGVKLLFTVVGVIAALWAFVTGADWLIDRGISHLKLAREAWRGPDLEMARLVASMNGDQLSLFERIGPFESVGYLTNTGMRWMFGTPMGKIPFTWITEYLEKCEAHYPALVPQHGMNDSLDRDYVRWFTAVMINKNAAEKPVGNKPAQWLIPMNEVYERVGLAED